MASNHTAAACTAWPHLEEVKIKMRTIIVALLLTLFLGLAGMAGAAVPYPVFNFGPESGFNNPGTIEAKYLWSTSDTQIQGNLGVTGTITAGAQINSGTVGTYLMMGADLPLSCLGTTNVFDWSNSTGAFSTSSGAVSLRGTTTVAASKTLGMAAGTGTLDFGRATGAFIGPAGTTYLNTTMIKAGKNLNVGSGLKANTVASNGTIVGGSSLAVQTTIKAGTGITGNTIASNGTIVGGSSLALQTTAKVGSTLSANGIKLNGTAGITGSTTITATNTLAWYTIDASGGDATLILPDAATVSGRVYYVGFAADPGTNYVRIKATAGTIMGIAGATGLKNTAAAGGITLLSDGTNYQVVGIWLASDWVSG